MVEEEPMRKRQQSAKREKALAVRLQTRRSRGDDWDETPIPADVHPNRGVVTSVRMPLGEFLAVQKAATAAGQTVSEYVRAAIAMRLRGMVRVNAVQIHSVARDAQSQATFVVHQPASAGGETRNPDPEINPQELRFANLTR
jgi:hypothetical protein